ncbi:MAG: hypothetical protein R6U88_06145 [Candidatus Bipolaricaulota bacterium]
MVELIDLTEGLTEYQRAARGMSPEQRIALWESLYTSRHPEFFRWYLEERISRDKLAESVARGGDVVEATFASRTGAAGALRVAEAGDGGAGGAVRQGCLRRVSSCSPEVNR